MSRNKREGRYVGWRKIGPMQRASDWANRKPGHQRVGVELRINPLERK